MQLLGGLTPGAFCKTIWHQKPLLIRNAISNIRPLLSAKQLFALARREHVESRLVTVRGGKWQLDQGPFKTLPARSIAGWTLLVQGVNVHSDAVTELMKRFSFIDRARLDDVMISYATDGGGVGAHFDSYDVFLLQVSGKRRWRISEQKDLSLRKGLPLKILKNFKPTQEWVLEPGDMLYLPPHVAHEGVAMGADCMTYSIGFRSPSNEELISALLDDMQASMDLPGQFSNSQAMASSPRKSATLPLDFEAQLDALAAKAFPDREALHDFLGRHLTEAKPRTPFRRQNSRSRANDGGIKLANASRALVAKETFFLNGESWAMSGKDAKMLTTLAEKGALTQAQVKTASAALNELLAAWETQGWVLRN
jgi:50S ribosomal protein L16 3-hydroxylase